MFAEPNGSGKSTIKSVKYTDRAYIFDNSSHQKIWIAEITDGSVLEIKSDSMPDWFKKALWDTFDTDDGASL